LATIRYDIDTLRATETGSALGQIWIEFGERCIPSARWDDFIVFVLDWWRLAIRNVLTGSQDPAIFAFMDDPYEVWMRPIEGGFSVMTTFHGRETATGNEDHAGMLDLVKTYCECVSVVLQRIEGDQTWRATYAGSVSQIEDLKAELPSFESLLEQLGSAPLLKTQQAEPN
jgi:hypothetical protein